MKAAEPRICPHCRESFVPTPYRPDQRVCSRPECQRRRRRDYHRRKREADPVYRQVCLDSQKEWRSRNPDYQKVYRLQNPESVERNREAQKRRDRRRRMVRLVKNNLALDLKAAAGEVWLMGPSPAGLEKNNVAFTQVMILQTVGRASQGPPAS